MGRNAARTGLLVATTIALCASRVEAAPELRMATAGPEGIQLVQTDEAFHRRFRVVAMNSDAVTDLQVSMAALQDAAGNEVKPDVKNAGRNVALASPMEFEVDAKLAALGVYTTDIELVYAGKRTSTRLTITRQAPKPAGIEGVSGGAGSLVRELWHRDPPQVKLALDLRETAGAKVSLDAPKLVWLQRKGNGATKLQKSGPTLSIVAPAAPIQLDALASSAIVLGVDGIDEPGLYEGSMRFTPGGGRLPLDVPFTIVTRQGWPLAALFIALGVLGSFGIRFYLSTWRQRLLWRRKLHELRAGFTAAAAGAPAAVGGAQRVGAGAIGLIDELEGKLGRAVPARVDTEIAGLESKLVMFREWIQSCVEVARLPAEATASLRGDLDEVAQAIEKPRTEEAIRSAATKLQGVRVGDAERKLLLAALESFRAELETTKHQADDVLLRAVERDVLPLLDAMGDDLATDRRTPARQTYEIARGKYAWLLVEALKRKLAGDPPPGFGEESWDALTKSAAAAVVPPTDAKGVADTISRYQELNRDYVSGLRRALVHEHQTVALDLEKAGAARGAIAARLDRVAADLARVSEETSPGAGAEAVAHAEGVCRAAKAELEAIADEVATMVPRVIPVSSTPAPVPSSGANPPLPASLAAAPPPTVEQQVRGWLDQAGRLTKQVDRYDVAVTVLLGVAAVFSGLKLLWVDNETWGGWDAWLVAGLWGFGLHQVGNVPFDGILSLRERFSRSGA